MARTQLLTPLEAGERLGLCPGTVKYYDDVLKPQLTASGRRIYSAAAVEAFRKRREAAKAARAQR